MKNLSDMFKQAQELQTKMAEAQEKLASAEAEGQAGAGMVRVRLSGKFELLDVFIDPSLLGGENAEVVQDLIKAAHQDARQKAETMMAESMRELTGGLPLPPGLRLPF
ncbi:MAG: YbaB/EbfC family nucleoid-associated protein [Rhodospirillales bacterium]